nr:MAG: nonstructural protein [Microvirus sp.]
MLLAMYSIYDEKSLTWTTPFFLNNNGTAIRQFTDAVNDSQTQFNKHPTDYSLYHLGTFNDNEASIASDKPAFLVKGIELLNETPADTNQMNLKLEIEELTKAVIALTSADIAN